MVRNLLLTVLAAGLFTAASAQTSRVRILHASPDAPKVDILVDGAKVIEGLPFREYTEYLPVPSGRREFRVNVNGTNTTVLSAAPTLSGGGDYTVIAVGFVGKSPALELMLLQDDNSDPRVNTNLRARIIHAAASAPGVDIYVTSPFETLEGKTAALTNVPFKGVGPYLEIPVATYQARVTVAGTKTVAIDSGRIATWNNIVRTFVAIDRVGGGAPFEIIQLFDKN